VRQHHAGVPCVVGDQSTHVELRVVGVAIVDHFDAGAHRTDVAAHGLRRVIGAVHVGPHAHRDLELQSQAAVCTALQNHVARVHPFGQHRPTNGLVDPAHGLHAL
jgi:hypothetical protein